MNKQKRITFLLKSLEGGGIERVVLNLLNHLSQRDDICLDLVVASLTGEYLNQFPPQVRVIDLQIRIENRSKSYLKLIPAIAKYLQKEKPDYLFSHLPIANVITVMSKVIARVPVSIFLVEHTLLFNSLLQREKRSLNDRPKRLDILPILLPMIMQWFYPQANGIIAVSKGLARELEMSLKLKPNSVQVIYNPVIDDNLLFKSRLPIEHPWFQPNQPPVLLAIGRLTAQKDYQSLLYAFARFREQFPAKLLILGEGELRSELEALVSKLSLENDVFLPGFVSNPYAYMSQATALVLSSVWEALPTVLIEAMACGCQVISTDCPYGPDEILEQGKYGWLVPVQDVTALATAMHQALNSPINPDKLKLRSQSFTVEQAVSNYLTIIDLKKA
ncbi:glycosyltransferase [Floridanema evergladense]|uniref:Glycosyltransferase n=1 Tax=Floridaenema evergladense BLCC-F167 TaxID=3153639 RepID=A0ABV4WRW1_9CYAN